MRRRSLDVSLDPYKLSGVAFSQQGQKYYGFQVSRGDKLEKSLDSAKAAVRLEFWSIFRVIKVVLDDSRLAV
jgi:hypothetical protein